MAEHGLQTPQRSTLTVGPRRRRSCAVRATVVVTLCLFAAACAANPEPSVPGDEPTSTEGQGKLVAPRTSPTPPTSMAPPTPTTPTAPGLPSTFKPSATSATIAGCEVFPPDHYMNATNIDRLPTHPRSAEWLTNLGGPGTKLRLANSKIWEGGRGGMPINIVDSREIGFSPILVNLSWTSKAYQGGYPVPPNPMVEGHPVAWTDKHMIMLDVSDCTVYETIGYEPLMFQLFGLHTALSGAKYRLDTTEMPILTTNAPNTPIVGQSVMREEVAAGLVPHVISFCTDSASNSYVWPARASDGPVFSDRAMPMGTWIRLSGDVDLSNFSGEARPVADALRRHGAVLTDTCGHPFRLRMENSSTWNDEQMDQLRALRVEDFEVVDSSHLIVDPNTFEIR